MRLGALVNLELVDLVLERVEVDLDDPSLMRGTRGRGKVVSGLGDTAMYLRRCFLDEG